MNVFIVPGKPTDYYQAKPHDGGEPEYTPVSERFEALALVMQIEVMGHFGKYGSDAAFKRYLFDAIAVFIENEPAAAQKVFKDALRAELAKTLDDALAELNPLAPDDRAERSERAALVAQAELDFFPMGRQSDYYTAHHDANGTVHYEPVRETIKAYVRARHERMIATIREGGSAEAFSAHTSAAMQRFFEHEPVEAFTAVLTASTAATKAINRESVLPEPAPAHQSTEYMNLLNIPGKPADYYHVTRKAGGETEYRPNLPAVHALGLLAHATLNKHVVPGVNDAQLATQLHSEIQQFLAHEPTRAINAVFDALADEMDGGREAPATIDRAPVITHGRFSFTIPGMPADYFTTTTDGNGETQYHANTEAFRAMVADYRVFMRESQIDTDEATARISEMVVSFFWREPEDAKALVQPAFIAALKHEVEKGQQAQQPQKPQQQALQPANDSGSNWIWAGLAVLLGLIAFMAMFILANG